MNYYEYTFTVNPVQQGNEVLIAQLADLPFESFVENETGVQAYIQEVEHNANDVLQVVNDLIERDIKITYTHALILQQNWNAQWESEFEPVIVSNECIIRAPFHTIAEQYKHTVTIMPQMSFGTGHHNTTWLMCNALLNNVPTNAAVLDMGCGTGVLAILAHKLGATKVDAIDIDEWSVTNSIENCALNKISTIDVWQGDATKMKVTTYDIILANINKNILKADATVYYQHLASNGIIYLSGFFTTDVDELKQHYKSVGFVFDTFNYKDEWAQLSFIKK
jgi:ribosomal protein L11 methyltransferase